MSAPEDYDADASKDEGLDEPKRRPRTDLSRRGELEYQTIGPLPEVPAPSGVRFDIPYVTTPPQYDREWETDSSMDEVDSRAFEEILNGLVLPSNTERTT